MGFLISAAAAVLVAASALFAMIFGKNMFTDWALIKRLAPLLATALLGIAFIAIFAFYRAAFIQMGPGQQALFGPVWPLLKLVLKKTAAALVDAGGNPDAAPYMLWGFDAVSAMCGKYAPPTP